MFRLDAELRVYVLARALAADHDDAELALEAYDAARVDRTVRIVRGANETAARSQDTRLDDPADAAQYFDTEWSSDKVRQRYDWLYEYKAVEVFV
jgi:salicylate hydroxylase